DFPVQPLARMHFALYATPSRAMSMLSSKITDWPRMRVGYSPVSQGQRGNDDRTRYFEHAQLSPEFVEYPTSAGAVEALHNGEIDALFLYTPFGKRPDGLTEVVPIGARNVYFAVRKGNPDLLERLSAAYREFYVSEINTIDEWRDSRLGVPRPHKRVRIAAYSRGDLFEVSPDGERSGQLEYWAKTVCGHTRWTLDYVYGGYDESLSDVMNGRLDIIGGVGYAPMRRDKFLYPHTPIGMLRVYLWTHPNSAYKPGDPSTWKGMRVGLLAGTVSATRAKRQFDREKDMEITCREFETDREMLRAYFAGEIDACVDVEMPELASELALHVYASHPMFVCVSLSRRDILEELENALEEICDDYPKYLRMISEHHYGQHADMAALSLQEAEWVNRRASNDRPIYIDFSPWPFDILDHHGNPAGFVGALLAELSEKTGLKFAPQQQTGIQTAEAKFLRGDTDLWIPWPAVAKEATYGATSIFSVPVPESVAKIYGAEDEFMELELFSHHALPPELVSILRKAAAEIEMGDLQEMFLRAAAERTVVHRVFGLTGQQLAMVGVAVVLVAILAFAIYGSVMMRLLRREADRANTAADAAEEHAQAKTRFLAMMSHELRTPLNAVIGFAEFLAREDTDEIRRKEYTDGILMSSTALLELINDILDLSKLEAGAMNMRSGACDIRQLLGELPAIFGYRVRRHGVKLNIDMPPADKTPVVELAQQGMRQILINIVGNAAKFTNVGSISARARWLPATNTLRLEISDTGCGISKDKMDRLFDPFVQDIASRMKSSGGETKGTGLGLPIVKRMVDAAGGTIHVESAPGKGTSFVIEIPNLKIVDTPQFKADPVVIPTIPERVLVVDDMVMNRKILGIHLCNIGVKDVRYAENGERALEVMNEWLPDIVLTDMWMPRMDGTQLAEAMRRDRRLGRIPIVAVTADVDVGSTYDISLFAKVVSKPVTAAKLSALFGEI
ncbi:MAG: transporter substrate-binding domain-containing protein, partial [Kiritimatiellae bacterium]|nr:transporter substrate-binding domain-containing protein [Kiritimatiellia bacterium]